MALNKNTTDEMYRSQSGSPDAERQVVAGGFTCLYNIPPGIITVILPGLSIFVAGVVLIVVSFSGDDQSSIAEGLPQVAVITVTVGGGWTMLVVGFWVMMCCHNRLTTFNKTTSSRTRRQESRSSVELVSISWRNNSLGSHGLRPTSTDQIRTV